MSGYVDWGFWVVYLPIVVCSIAAGWWIRGVRDEEVRRQEAKAQHPAFRVIDGEGEDGWTGGWDRGA